MTELEEITNTGFKNPNDFSLYVEEIKRKQNLETYIEAVVWFAENETDLEMEQIVRYLNKKILTAIEYEANELRMLKENSKSIELFD